MTTITGRCHCGNVEVGFETARPASELVVRACQCTFCRRHGVRSVSDPKGRISIRVAVEAQLSRYRFGLGLAEMLVCRICGCYAGAVMAHEGGHVGVLNANLLDAPELSGRAAQSVSYDGETAEARRDRRLKLWTPAVFVP